MKAPVGLTVLTAMFMAPGWAAGQTGERVSLNSMTRLNSGAEGSFAFTCMIEVMQPANSQLTVRLVEIAGGRITAAQTSTFSWRGAADAGESAKGQVLLFGQSGSDVGKPGKHYLTLLAGFEGNPVQRGEGVGSSAVENAGGWWSRYGAEEAVSGQPAVLYVMGSGETATDVSLTRLQEQSKNSQQKFVAVTVEFGPSKK